MKIRAILTVLSLDALIASATDTQATATTLTNTLHIMMDLSSLTANAAIDIFPSTADRFLQDVIGGFELITTAAENEVLVLSNSQQAAAAMNNSMQKQICEMFSDFTDVHLILMDMLIGKNDTLALVRSNATSTPPDILPQLESRVNGCSKAVTSLTQLTLPLVPICTGDIVGDQRRYTETTEKLRMVLNQP